MKANLTTYVRQIQVIFTVCVYCISEPCNFTCNDERAISKDYKEDPNNGIKYWQIINLLKVLYPEYIKDFYTRA